MKKVKVSFDTWIQLLGMVGVLGGLVFVGLEMRQSQRIALVNQLQERSYKAVDTVNATLEADLDFFSTAFLIAPPAEGLTRQERAERNMHNIVWFFNEADYFQYSQGLMTDAVWQSKLRAIEINLQRCKFPEIYDARIAVVEEGFRDIVESLSSDECTTE